MARAFGSPLRLDRTQIVPEWPLREAVVEAYDGGVAIAKLARAAGVTRQAVYNWLEAREH